MSKIGFKEKFRVAGWVEANHAAFAHSTYQGVVEAVRTELGIVVNQAIMRGVYRDLELDNPSSGGPGRRSNQWGTLSARMDALEDQMKQLQALLGD